MPRLAVVDTPQHGSSTGGARNEERISSSRKRSRSAPPALGRDRASRFHDPVVDPDTGVKTRTVLDKDQQAMVVLGYMSLPKGKAAHSAALVELCDKYNVNLHYPARLVAQLASNEALISRVGVGGKPRRITTTERDVLIRDLRENAYDLTYLQIQEATSIPRAVRAGDSGLEDVRQVDEAAPHGRPGNRAQRVGAQAPQERVGGPRRRGREVVFRLC